MEHTSDVTRFRGALIGVLLAVAVAVAGLVLFLQPAHERAPGPLGRSHLRAGLECASCHFEGGERPARTACGGCHGAHASVRGPHQALRDSGLLTCIDCHRVHRDLGGVAFEGEGRAWRFGPGGQTAVDAPAALGSGIVAVVPAGACGRCHEPEDARDPIARCLIAGQASLGPERPTVCFDEHRPLLGEVLGRGGDAGERRVLWAGARHVLASAPTVPPPPPPPSAGLWIGIAAAAVFASIVGLLLVRTVASATTETASGAGDVAPPQRRRLPVISATTCIGCSACVDACPYDVLVLEQYVAKLAQPDDCCGLTLCEQKCPNGSLVVTDGGVATDQPRIDASLQSLDQPGLYIAGDLTGMPLIRNAINQGAAATKALAATLAPRRGGDLLDLVIVGAGPAGLSAALAATDLHLDYVVLEQASVAQSIRSFPRGKLVFDQPLGLPRVGDLWLAESTKEELLGKWLRIVRAQKLQIREGRRVLAVTPEPGPHEAAFRIEVRTGDENETYRARRVVLALGKRGTPRKLSAPIPEAMIDHVHYSLADAASFAAHRTLVVGLGDVAMETAIALAGQAGTRVTVSYRGAAFSRGKRRNIDEIQRLAAAGRLTLHMQTTVTEVAAGQATLAGPDGPSTVPCDAIFVMIGAIAPWDFLGAAGVNRADSELPASEQEGEAALNPISG